MVIGRGGYVGMTAVEAGCTDIAAALDVDFMRAHGGPAGGVRAILSSANVPATAALETLDWQGTLPLTRRLPLPVAHRMFVIGDAAGYVEPFTGEGIAWALGAADAVVPFVVRAHTAGWDPLVAAQWLGAFERIVRRKQWWCRTLARALRYPPLTGVMVAALSRRPALAGPFLSHLTRDAGRRRR
jgi:2-polyprenyl-6-methoxyphenol hydroxylase-like FAD-dependent oxidoreductase